MELFFDINRSRLNHQELKKSNNIIKISSGNLLAFSTNLEIETEVNRGERKPGNFLYVSDLNIPFFVYEVTNRKFPISAVEWDKSGKYLLVGDTNGLVSVYTQKNNLINDWMSVYEVHLSGENVLKAVFFHNGFKLKYNHEKKDQTSCTDKYQRVKFQPSVRKFGGVAEFGCLLITATGMIASFLIPSADIINPANLADHKAPINNNNSEVTTESLGMVRNFYDTADVAYTHDGYFLVAVSNSNTKSYKSCVVQCYKVSVSVSNSKLTVKSNALPSFFPSESNNSSSNPNSNLVKLRWLSEEDPDSILILTNSPEGSVLDLWHLTEETAQIHKLFQQNKPNSYKVSVWNHKSTSASEKKASNLTTTKFLFGVKQPAHHIFVCYQDNSVLCFNTDGFKILASVNVNTSYMVRGSSEIEISPKQTKMTGKLADFDLSYFSHLLVILDSVGNIYCYKNNFIINESLEGIPNSAIQQSVNLLEYCLVSGADTLDVIWCLKLNLLDQIIDKFTENFNRQNSAFIQFYYVKFLIMKTCLHRMSSSGQVKANDLLCLLNLHSILTAFKSLLRPADLTFRDKGPAENLALTLSDINGHDVDKVLLNLEAKDFAVEKSTLQSLQQLIQWVGDLALNILAKLPDCRGFLSNSKTSGDISDIVALSSIRELLVIIRIWGLLKPSCLPQFLKSTDNDVLLTIFKLLTKLALNPNDPDEYLLDECCLLPNQVLVQQLQLNVPRICVSSFYLVHLQAPLHLEYGTECEKLRFVPDQPNIEGCLTNNNIVDSIRYIQIGKNQTVRRCTRCGAYASLNNIAKTVAMKSWENRFSSCNGCGGSWQRVKS